MGQGQAHAGERYGCEMRSVYLVKSIAPQHAEQAYPLVQAVAPTIDRDRWARYCAGAEATRDKSDLLGVLDEGGYLRAIASVLTDRKSVV